MSTDLVALVKADLEARGVQVTGSVAGAFEVTKRVAWQLRAEGAGLLLKPAGENIVTWQGQSFSASRICYPDGRLVKILTDVPTTNGPSWQDNGTVDRRLYVAAIDPDPAPVVVEEPDPIVEPLPDPFLALHAKLDALKVQSDANTEKILTRITEVVENAEKSAQEYLPLLAKLEKFF